MRHNNKINHLGRKYAHREAMLSNMACSLIVHKRIFTTLAKAKELRKYIEPLITKSKVDTTHSRRLAFQELRNKYAVTELFKEVSMKVADRPGGYTRIIKTGNRLGDNASMCFIELVDYNELMLKEKSPKKGAVAKTRRSRRGGTKGVEVTSAITEKGAISDAPLTEISAAGETVIETPIVVEESQPEVSITEEKTEEQPSELPAEEAIPEADEK